MEAFTKIINPIEGYYGQVFCKITYDEKGRLSISGVEGPLKSGNCKGACGQIDTGWKIGKGRYSVGWSIEKEKKFLDIWQKWHLNDMQEACKHQRKLGWTYKEHHNPETFKGDNCSICGYSIGSAWLKKEVPEDVLQWLCDLPDSQLTPAWI